MKNILLAGNMVPPGLLYMLGAEDCCVLPGPAAMARVASAKLGKQIFNHLDFLAILGSRVNYIIYKCSAGSYLPGELSHPMSKKIQIIPMILLFFEDPCRD